MAEGDSGSAADKPHPATPRQRKKFREQGRFARARDATAVATIGGVLSALLLGHGAMGRAFDVFAQRCFADLSALGRGDGGAVLANSAAVLLALAAPPALAAALLGSAAGAAQAGFRLYPKLLQPKLDRLDPIARLKKTFKPTHALYELALALVRVGIVGAVCYQSLRDDVPTLLGLTGAPVTASLGVTAAILARMVAKVLGVLLVMAAIDYAHSHHTLSKQMRMSTRELRDEMREQEQDPKLKGKLRQRGRDLTRQHLVAAVSEAQVVVTNPSHVAVALRYGASDFAPTVVAKGHDLLAHRIRAEARKHAIPICESRRLARALDAEVEIGQPIAEQHYVAVAQVLAFVFNLRSAERPPTN